MAYFEGRNYASRYNEIYDYCQNPVPFRMDEPEITDMRQEPRDFHYNMGGYYNQEVPQFYYNGNGHDYPRYDDRNHRETYAPNQISFPMDQQDQLPSQPITVQIRLSRRIDIDRLRSALYQQHNMSCEVSGNVITVTGSPGRPRGYAAQDFLDRVVRLSGDSGATLVANGRH